MFAEDRNFGEGQVIDSVRNAVRSIDKDQPISTISTYNQIISDVQAQRGFSVTLMGIFASLAMFIAAIGIYGVMNYSVSQRVYEMGIRMALGAERRDIFKLVVSNGLPLAVIGIVIGMGGAYFATRYLESMLFHITRTDPMIFISMPLIMLTVALAACYFPARRAANVDPMISLREY
jgi:putative ABC transport system permease protein